VAIVTRHATALPVVMLPGELPKAPPESQDEHPGCLVVVKRKRKASNLGVGVLAKGITDVPCPHERNHRIINNKAVITGLW